jgi:AraC-like DNA-binding protein
MFSDGHLGEAQRKLLTHPPLLKTTDVEEAASLLATSAVPYRSELLAPASTFSTQIYCARSARMHLSRVKTTGSMRVNAQLPDDAYAIVFAVSGEVEHRVAGDMIRVRPGLGLVQSPAQAVAIQTPQSFELIFLKITRELLVGELEKLLQRPIHTALNFSPAYNAGTEAGTRFRHQLLNLFVDFSRLRVAGPEHPESRGAEPNLSARTIENEMVGLLLEGQRHNYTRFLFRHQDAAPWQVRAAEEYISANAHLTLTLGDICLAAGVGSRTLQHSFRRKRGYTPMQFLRQLRMERVHADLSLAGSGATVTEVATRWGFLHFGRFAGDYQKQFGEKPSETLQRERERH